MSLAAACACALLPFGWGASGAAEPIEPGQVDGLAAWYKVDSLHARHNEGSLVTAWPDSSGNNHDLAAVAGRMRALFRTRQLNGKPVVAIRRGTSFSVTDPFDLQDYVIFLVYKSDYTRRALLRSDTDKARGIILRAGDDRYHKFQNGGPEYLTAFNKATPLGKEFSITVLSRVSGSLGCRVNGVDISSGSRFTDPLRVGVFFDLTHTQFARSDGQGVSIAEMLFYDRFLPKGEFDGVTLHLSEKYGIDVEIQEALPQPVRTRPRITWGQESARAWLTTTARIDVNATAVVIPWDGDEKLLEPFRHGSGDQGSRLYCTRDGIQVELFVRLPVTTTVEGAAIRVLVLKNGEEYLHDDVSSGEITGDGETKRGIVELLTTVRMNEEDYLEVVASQNGKAGVVTLDPAEAVFGARMH
jgi:hypothetical protein